MQTSNLYRRVVNKTRYWGKRINYSIGTGVVCNVCGWQGRCFDNDKWHKDIVCPACRLVVRHRLMLAALTHLPRLSVQQLVVNKAILHFAPEGALQQFFAERAAVYQTADIEKRPNIDLQLDISAMPEALTANYDLLIACDVLEHVPDDQKALQEIWRVLRPGGYALLSVPQQDHLTVTYTDPTIITPRDRERVFGQWNHLRIYGADFVDLISKTNFCVTVIDDKSFPAELAQKHRLFPPQLSTNLLATNFRKVYFAQKPLGSYTLDRNETATQFNH